MKYVCEVEINIPVEKVVDFWSDEINFSNWQDGFISIELLEGNWNVEGSKSKILFKNGKQKMELIETVISNNLPFSKKALYEHIHMSNTQLSRFEKISDIICLETSSIIIERLDICVMHAQRKVKIGHLTMAQDDLALRKPNFIELLKEGKSH